MQGPRGEQGGVIGLRRGDGVLIASRKGQPEQGDTWPSIVGTLVELIVVRDARAMLIKRVYEIDPLACTPLTCQFLLNYPLSLGGGRPHANAASSPIPENC